MIYVYEIRSQYADGGTSIPTAARNAGLCRRHRLNDCSLKRETAPASVSAITTRNRGNRFNTPE